MFAYAKKAERMGNIQTPLPLAQWIYDTVQPSVDSGAFVLDPACGSGNLLAPWHPHRDYNTIGIDPIQPESTKHFTVFYNENFETWKSNYSSGVRIVLCNPPWNGNWKKESYPEVFFKRIIHLFGPKIPLVFLCPMGFRLNQRCNSRRWRLLRDSGAKITSLVSIPIDFYPETQFHSEILFFNLPKLEPHYFLPDKVVNSVQDQRS